MDNHSMILVNKGGITSSKFSPILFRKTNKEKQKIEKMKIELQNEGEYSNALGALSDLSHSEFGDLNNFDHSLLIGYSNEMPNTIYNSFFSKTHL